MTIRRNHPTDAWRRGTFVRVDGGANHSFTFGHSVTIELTPGRHSLFAGESLLQRTIRFDVAPGEHAEFTIVCQPPVPGFGFLSGLRFVPGSVRVLRSTHRK